MQQSAKVHEEEDRATIQVVHVSDDGNVLIRRSDGYLETWTIPLERVPHYRRLVDRVISVTPNNADR